MKKLKAVRSYFYYSGFCFWKAVSSSLPPQCLHNASSEGLTGFSAFEKGIKEELE
jgi:hypothetical protein